VHEHRRRTLRRTAFISSIWLLYLAGAALGAVMRSAWGLHALYVPIFLLLLAILIDQLFPLAVEEERDEPER
jgi:uncharacterized membrane protein YoaK (UPF0700 family)